MTRRSPKIPKGPFSKTAAGSPASRRIVTAARHHFLTHGFRSVTMDDLAEEVGMSKKTLYAFFPSKAALLEAVLLDKFRSIEGELDIITSNASDDVLAALHQLLACVQRHTEEIRPPFVRDLRREGLEIFKLIESRRRALIQLYFGKFFDEGRKAGIIRKDIPTRLMIEILLGATEAVMNPQKIAELDLTPKSGYSVILSVILKGVLVEKRRAKP